VVSVGSEVNEPKLTEGTVVLFRKGLGESVRHANKDYLLLPLKEVIGIFKEVKND
jgi:co-chaperonin GroES (HSP10)